jgi:hypothetical protein
VAFPSLLCASLIAGAASLLPCQAAEPGEKPCCDVDVTLRGVADRVTFSEGPLLKPSDRGREADFSQARVELSARGPLDDPDAPFKWALRGYARSAHALGLLDAEGPAFIKVRQAFIAVPVFDGDLAVGRIVAGSGTLRTRNLVDYLDNLSVHIETRSGFLPERLDNRIGQVGAQVSQVASLGAVQWMVARHISNLTDSNSQGFSLLRIAPTFSTGTASAEALWFWSRQRVAFGAQGTVSPTPGIQLYGELSHERRWPVMQAAPAGIDISYVHATLVGGGLEFKPDAAWSVAAELLHNDHAVASGAFDDASRYLATATLPQAIGAAGLLRNLPYGFQQPWYVGALLQCEWPDQKLKVALSYYRALDDGSAVSTAQARWGIGKRVEVSVFARVTQASTGQELQFTPEARRFGAAANFAF